jgi:hypothetical protein
MKKLLLALLILMTIPSTAFSKEKKPVHVPPTPVQTVPNNIQMDNAIDCIPVNSAVTALGKEKSSLIFFGNDDTGNTTMLFYNQDDSKWYIIKVPKENPGLACLLSSGEAGETNIPSIKVPVPEREATFLKN